MTTKHLAPDALESFTALAAELVEAMDGNLQEPTESVPEETITHASSHRSASSSPPLFTVAI